MRFQINNISGSIFTKLLVMILVVIMLAACGSAEQSGTSAEQDRVVDSEPAAAEPVVAEPTVVLPTEIPPTQVPPTPTEDPNTMSPGTYLVNTDIEPGIYTGVAGEGLFDSCYWERLSDLSGDFAAILANDNSEGRFYIEVLGSDAAFKIDCAFSKYDPETAVHETMNTIAVGTNIIGKDIEPGIYRGEAGIDMMDSCYWETLSGFSGDFNNIIANDNGVGQYFVEVTEADLAIKSSCPLEKYDINQAPADPLLTSLDPGTYVVGVDIAPGTYKGLAGDDIMDSCYWVRLSNLKGGFDSIIANDNATGQFYVQVTGGDLALTTTCPLEFAQ